MEENAELIERNRKLLEENEALQRRAEGPPAGRPANGRVTADAVQLEVDRPFHLEPPLDSIVSAMLSCRPALYALIYPHSSY